VSESTESRQLRHELLRLMHPATQGLLWTVERLHWWLGVLLVAYLTSGITFVQPDEVAVVYRFGRLVGDGAGAVQAPGVLIALPRPMDRVVRVPAAKVFETELRELHFSQTEDKASRYLVTSRTTLDPERVGYVVTGDQNIVHVAMVARWQVSDPIAWSQAVEAPEDLLRTAVLASTVNTMGALAVDGVLADGRQTMVDDVTRQAQARLDGWGAGVSLVSLELLELGPPQQVREAFREVQTTAIEAETRVKAAREYREVQVPKARTDARRKTREAEAGAVELTQRARSESHAFLALLAEYQRDPVVVRERLYREGIESVLDDAGAVDFVPPPAGPRYSGTRITVDLRRSGDRDD
jgi:modulator of FtsH protease HflK